jgi:hypothetical protein
MHDEATLSVSLTNPLPPIEIRESPIRDFKTENEDATFTHPPIEVSPLVQALPVTLILPPTRALICTDQVDPQVTDDAMETALLRAILESTH